MRVMNNSSDIEERAKKVSKLSLTGISAMGFPDKISPVRGVMNTRQSSQRVVLDNPEFCKLYTGAENPFGKRSSWNIKADANYRIEKIFRKFKDIPNTPVTYILKNVETGEYSCQIFNPAVNLIEKYGFEMRNCLNFKNEGDYVLKGEPIRQSSSFVNDNYCAGVNARIANAVLPGLTEDAIIISQDFADRCSYKMVDLVDVPLKKDAFLLNQYGNDSVYKSFPNIGEDIVDGVLTSIRENSFVSSAHEATVPHINDVKKISHGKVVDIDIFTNCEVDNEQFNYYLRQIREYYTDLFAYISTIIDNISCEKQISRRYDDSEEETEDPYDTTLLDLYHQADKFLSPAVWATKEDIADTIMKFVVLKPVKIRKGQKIVGRLGNKSVVSEIRPTHLMPKTDDGRPLDVIANALSLNNRIIVFANYESETTFLSERFYQHFIRRDENGDDHDLIMQETIEFISYFSKYQASEVERLYIKDKDRIYNDILKNGIFIWVPPMGEECIRDAILQVYERFPDIMTKYRLLRKLRHRWVDVVSPDATYSIGYQYMWVLKQEPSKAMSVVSTGRTTLHDQPIKTRQYNKNLKWYSSNTIKFGEYDTYNMLAAIGVRDFAKMATYFRGSQYEENSILMSHLNNKKIDTSKYNKFPQLDNLKNVLKFIGESLEPDIFNYNTIGADDIIYDVQINNVTVPISIPLLRYILIMYSYYCQYYEYKGGIVDLGEFFTNMRAVENLWGVRTDEEISFVFTTFSDLLPTLKQLKEY